jgi:hypothetical protein
MTNAEQEKAKTARKLRARADKLCVRADKLRVRADNLFDRAEAAASEADELLAQVDETYAEANALHGNVVRRQCLKCACSFGSKGSSNRLCTSCNRTNATLLDSPSSPPKWNGQPMCKPRQTY